MVRLETRVRRHDRVALVEGRLTGEDRPVRVTLATDADPVHPPRSGGRPVVGWRPADGTVTLLVGADRRVGVGFATTGAVGESPLSVVETEFDPPASTGLPATPGAVVRALGDPRPPTDAVGRETGTGDRR